MSKENIAVIQGRMGSSRFPGKTLANIAGKPLIWHIIHRLRKSSQLTKIIIATSALEENDILEEFAKKQKLPIIRGDENNVFSRFEKAFEIYQPDTLTRVCGDCPLIEPSFIDRSIKQILSQNVDYLKADSKIIHQGVETISKSCFKKIQSFRDNPIVKEHVTALIYKNPNLYKIGKLKVFNYEKNSGIRLSIDTRSDLQFIRALYKKSFKRPGLLSIKEMLEVIKKNPTLLEQNSHVFQKKATQKTEFVYFQFCSEHNNYFLQLAKDYSESKGYGIKFLATNSVEHQVGNFCKKGISAVILESDEQIIKFIARDQPKIFFSTCHSVTKDFKQKYNIEFLKKHKLYKLIRC
tara:strand:- start:693 stop:1745 length:1053 start_codon:yes stop_codon:yes gene_type:complete